MQTAAVLLNDYVISVDLPDPSDDVLPNIKWGLVEAFPSPAYWAYQIIGRRITGKPIRYRMGETLLEEVGACMLGGHGIPAIIGVAAFEELRLRGAFSGESHTSEQLFQWLSQPIQLNGKIVRYRFAKQKAKYLASALAKFIIEKPPMSSGRALRDWLLGVQGVGYKTASWIARNWLNADDVAILDIHIYRAGLLAGFFDPLLTVERDYLALEKMFLDFSNALGFPASELDAEIWWQMSNSFMTVHSLLNGDNRYQKKSIKVESARPKQRQTDTSQTAFLI